jgi:hypothetical protein
VGVGDFGRKEESTGLEAVRRWKYCCLGMWDMPHEDMDLPAKRESAWRGEARKVFGI